MANSYLTRTYGSAGNQRIFTISFWFKRSNLATGHFWTYQDANSAIRSDFSIVNDRIGINFNPTGSAWGADLTIQENGTNILFRDTNAWYHIVMAFDTTQSTEANRLKVYVNGVQKTMSGYPSQNFDTGYNTAIEHAIGTYAHSVGGNYFDGYISHFAVVDGQQLAPTVFGETDSTSGIWKFKSPSGVTWGTNGFHLKFENSGNLGLDSSGQTNNFTTNGNLKQALDSPSNVYATWNSLDNYYQGGTGSNGNNTWQTNNSNYSYRPATLGVSSGKWYWEVKYVAKSGGNDYPQIGITSTQTSVNNGLGDNANDWSYYQSNATSKLRNNSSSTNWGTSYTVGDIIGVALDCDNNKLYFHKNGAYQESGNPTAGSGGISITAPASTPLGLYFPAFTYYDGTYNGTFSANFGNGFFGTTAITSAGSNGNGSLFEYDVPSGFYALNTKNINTYG